MTQTLTITEAAKALNVSDKTIRRWIDVGKLTAEKVDRKWYAHVDLDIDLDIDPDNDQANVYHLKAQLERADSEIAHLREQLARRDEQIDHLTQLLAMQTKTTAALTEQLDTSRAMIEDMRRRKPVWKRLFRR
jgi:excisionase family DNA binding protein